MGRDEEEEGFQKRKKKSVGFGGWRAMVVFLVIGLALGVFFEHQYIEPLLNGNAKKLASCESTGKLLNSEIEACYMALADANSPSPAKE